MPKSDKGAAKRVERMVYESRRYSTREVCFSMCRDVFWLPELLWSIYTLLFAWYIEAGRAESIQKALVHRVILNSFGRVSSSFTRLLCYRVANTAKRPNFSYYSTMVIFKHVLPTEVKKLRNISYKVSSQYETILYHSIYHSYIPNDFFTRGKIIKKI